MALGVMMVAYFLSGLARKEELVGDVDDDDDDDENNNKDGADDVAAAAAPMPRTPTTRDLVGRRESIILTVGKENTAVYSMSAFKTTVRGVIMVLRVENSASSVMVTSAFGGNPFWRELGFGRSKSWTTRIGVGWTILRSHYTRNYWTGPALFAKLPQNHS